jgi:hypothetical protein
MLGSKREVSSLIRACMDAELASLSLSCSSFSDFSNFFLSAFESFGCFRAESVLTESSDSSVPEPDGGAVLF